MADSGCATVSSDAPASSLASDLLLHHDARACVTGAADAYCFLCAPDLLVPRWFEHVMQGISQSQVPASGLPILQLAWTSPKRSNDQLLLACRTSYWLCIYEAEMAPDPDPGKCIPKQLPNCVALK